MSCKSMRGSVGMLPPGHGLSIFCRKVINVGTL